MTGRFGGEMRLRVVLALFIRLFCTVDGQKVGFSFRVWFLRGFVVSSKSTRKCASVKYSKFASSGNAVAGFVAARASSWIVHDGMCGQVKEIVKMHTFVLFLVKPFKQCPTCCKTKQCTRHCRERRKRNGESVRFVFGTKLSSQVPLLRDRSHASAVYGCDTAHCNPRVDSHCGISAVGGGAFRQWALSHWIQGGKSSFCPFYSCF